MAVKKYYEDGCSPRMIFEEAGIDRHIVGLENPDQCLKRWRATYSNKLYMAQESDRLLVIEK